MASSKTLAEHSQNVHVLLSRSDSSQSVAETVTDASGRFRFAGLRWGLYNIDLAADGWQNERIRVDLRSDSTLYVPATLSPPSGHQAPARVEPVDGDVWFGTQFNDLAIQKLPNGRDIWSLLQGQEASTVTTRFEIGGLQTAVPALFAAHGASWTENQYQFNGLDVTDPYVPGLSLINPGIDALSEFQVVTASKPAAPQASGENLRFAPSVTTGNKGLTHLFPGETPVPLSCLNASRGAGRFWSCECNGDFAKLIASFWNAREPDLVATRKPPQR